MGKKNLINTYHGNEISLSSQKIFSSGRIKIFSEINMFLILVSIQYIFSKYSPLHPLHNIHHLDLRDHIHHHNHQMKLTSKI